MIPARDILSALSMLANEGCVVKFALELVVWRGDMSYTVTDWESLEPAVLVSRLHNARDILVDGAVKS